MSHLSYFWRKKQENLSNRHLSKYSRTSVAQTLMACLPWLILESLGKDPIAADLGKFRIIFFFILKMVYCVYPLKLPLLGDSNEKKHAKENRKYIPIILPNLAL